MARNAVATAEILQRWRANKLDQLDRTRFAVIEALHARTQAHDGEVRALLQAKLEAMVTSYTERIAEAPAAAQPGQGPSPGRIGLQALVTELTGQHKPAYPELPLLADVRAGWATLRNASQLKESLAQVPTNGGPLNSGVLVHRALTLMKETSPGYLTHFMAYLDALSGMEHLHQWGVLVATPKVAPRGAKPRRPRAGKAAG
ncbi:MULTISPECIES: DUF2894 domain-containing protein [Stenotrophomonas]|jgi:hypothetical protein|uniref:DUF2894 domain-containing protein n=1 Tax=Stenotrophomonas TaxID=40323 RepID=UPI0024DEB093|nr:DUF2894 domain-containing protein [Stenotrophomonas sp. BIO128-Bstrain]WIA62873.1 DUF2894 domain-containing protein [Stenotrophomonas sp. BIO128-Bstrain]